MQNRRSLSVWFYRDDRQLEVDFLLLGGGRGDVIEAKWTESPNADDARAVRQLIALTKERGVPDLAESRGVILCRTPEPFPVGGVGPQVDAMGLEEFITSIR